MRARTPEQIDLLGGGGGKKWTIKSARNKFRGERERRDSVSGFIIGDNLNVDDNEK